MVLDSCMECGLNLYDNNDNMNYEWIPLQSLRSNLENLHTQQATMLFKIGINIVLNWQKSCDEELLLPFCQSPSLAATSFTTPAQGIHTAINVCAAKITVFNKHIIDISHVLLLVIIIQFAGLQIIIITKKFHLGTFVTLHNNNQTKKNNQVEAIVTASIIFHTGWFRAGPWKEMAPPVGVANSIKAVSRASHSLSHWWSNCWFHMAGKF